MAGWAAGKGQRRMELWGSERVGGRSELQFSAFVYVLAAGFGRKQDYLQCELFSRSDLHKEGGLVKTEEGLNRTEAGLGTSTLLAYGCQRRVLMDLGWETLSQEKAERQKPSAISSSR